MRHASRTPTALAERTRLPCPNLYDLLSPVRALRKELGLTTNDLAVLTALISFLPREGRGNLDSHQLALTVVFPSNASLSERANGIDERTLRRSLGRLAAADLIERKNSANGKRFPLRYGGVIRDAFGIDLKPLIQHCDLLVARASKLAEEHERLRSLKAEALALRASLLQQERIDETRLSTLGAIRNILRRATLTADAVLRIIAELRKLGAEDLSSYGERLGSASCLDDPLSQAVEDRLHEPCSNNLPGRNGQNVRHIESIKKEFKKIKRTAKPVNSDLQASAPSINRDPGAMVWEDFTHVAGFFPEAPRTGEALTQILFDLGRLLKISQKSLTRGLQTAGAGKLLLILDYLIARADAIKQPDAYFEKVLRA